MGSKSLSTVEKAMKVPIDFQVIKDHGKPMFAVVPYDEFLRLINPQPTIPHEVVSMTIREGLNLVAAWRKYLGLSQLEVARRLKISQSALSQIEHARQNTLKTLQKIAQALDITVEQLRD